MDKEKLKKLAEDQKFISGIYNYCDRWCERCLFTDRCLNYAMGEEDRDNPEIYDLNSEAFWKRMHESFQLAMELLQEMAQEQGIDLNDMEDDESIANHHELQLEKANEHELTRSAKKYAKMVDKWFEENRNLFEQRENDLNTEFELGIDRSKLDTEADSLIDCMEVIGWYQHQIYVKLMRALTANDHDTFAEEHGFPKDSDGSVKVALIGMDRSIGAWGRLIDHFPDKQDQILSILVHLDRLRKNTEKTFPDARSFVRPGFDTMTSPEI